jgi:hypothetical protein
LDRWGKWLAGARHTKKTFDFENRKSRGREADKLLITTMAERSIYFIFHEIPFD